jgi:menaquinol-cytochrome c reductase iron-sulfur subunit
VSPTRRVFLKWATALGSVVSTALVAWPALRAFFSPAFRAPQSARWIKIGEVDQLEMGVPTRFDFGDTIHDAWVESRVLRGVWIYTDDGKKFTVYNGRCTHLGCGYSFDDGRKMFHCPCHHGLFNLKTGKVIDGPPPRPLDTLDTKVEEGILFVAYRDFREGVPEKVAVS